MLVKVDYIQIRRMPCLLTCWDDTRRWHTMIHVDGPPFVIQRANSRNVTSSNWPRFFISRPPHRPTVLAASSTISALGPHNMYSHPVGTTMQRFMWFSHQIIKFIRCHKEISCQPHSIQRLPPLRFEIMCLQWYVDGAGVVTDSAASRWFSDLTLVILVIQLWLLHILLILKNIHWTWPWIWTFYQFVYSFNDLKCSVSFAQSS